MICCISMRMRMPWSSRIHLHTGARYSLSALYELSKATAGARFQSYLDDGLGMCSDVWTARLLTGGFF